MRKPRYSVRLTQEELKTLAADMSQHVMTADDPASNRMWTKIKQRVDVVLNRKVAVLKAKP